jgi:hypothetical protein
MPNFASSQHPSGPAGAAGRHGNNGQRSNVFGVGQNGIANRRNDGNTVVASGAGPYAGGKMKGPNQPFFFEPEFNSQKQRFRGNFSISGQTLNAAGTPLAECRVELNESRSDVEYAETISDGSGNYSFTIPYNSWNWQVIAYKVGSPDVAGVTVDTLTATWNGN